MTTRRVVFIVAVTVAATAAAVYAVIVMIGRAAARYVDTGQDQP